ncbi:hypothetical protein [Amycolatopsis sp. NPDC004079]|uniref:Uncharacterized protein n=1 Tax=Amycolatopsis halotolerans TaxID=330083 RepID=A0ABV7QG82_9PSEU
MRVPGRAALGVQDKRDEQGQLARHVKRGTMGNHVGPPDFSDSIFEKPVLL